MSCEDNFSLPSCEDNSCQNIEFRPSAKHQIEPIPIEQIESFQEFLKTLDAPAPDGRNLVQFLETKFSNVHEDNVKEQMELAQSMGMTTDNTECNLASSGTKSECVTTFGDDGDANGENANCTMNTTWYFPNDSARFKEDSLVMTCPNES